MSKRKRSKRGKGVFATYKDDSNLVMRYYGGVLQHYTRPKPWLRWRYVSRHEVSVKVTRYGWAEKSIPFKNDATSKFAERRYCWKAQTVKRQGQRRPDHLLAETKAPRSDSSLHSRGRKHRVTYENYEKQIVETTVFLPDHLWAKV
jgi:hypothetical protein